MLLQFSQNTIPFLTILQAKWTTTSLTLPISLHSRRLAWIFSPQKAIINMLPTNEQQVVAHHKMTTLVRGFKGSSHSGMVMSCSQDLGMPSQEDWD